MKSRCNKNQLFKTIPPRELVYKVLQTFGLNGLDDTRNFTRQDINKLGTIDKIYLLKPLLEEYYLPCKARTYLNDINEKNIITILRQLIRIYGYSIVSREKYIKGNKFIPNNWLAICPNLGEDITISLVDNFVSMYL